MTTLLHLDVPKRRSGTLTAERPNACVTPGCPHMVTEPWEESGLLCYECAIEGELFDRDARWDHVCPIPGTHCLPCQAKDEALRQEMVGRAKLRTKN